jgi:glycosyltransferase involved in cell wall biosynthesis
MVVITRNEGFRLKDTVQNLEDTLPGNAEILVVDDASTDGSTAFLAAGRKRRVRLIETPGIGVAKARNAGGRRARGDVLIFADAHLWLPSDWWKALLDSLADPRVGGVAPVIAGMNPKHLEGYGITFRDPSLEVRWIRRKPRVPTPVPILPGCTFAMSRAAFECPCGGWDDGLLQRGNVDNECSVRLWLLGYKLLLVPDVVVKHYYRKRAPFNVGAAEYLHNRLRMAFAHFNDERLRAVISSLRNYEGFPEALRLIASSAIAERRRQLLAVRKHTDNWFFDRFNLNW